MARYPEVMTARDRRFELTEVLRAAREHWEEGMSARLQAIEEVASDRLGEHVWPRGGSFWLRCQLPSCLFSVPRTALKTPWSGQ